MLGQTEDSSKVPTAHGDDEGETEAAAKGGVQPVESHRILLAKALGRIRRLSADKGHDGDWQRAALHNNGVMPVIPGKRGRKRRIRHESYRSRERWCIEAMFDRLKDFRRIPTRDDKLARNYASALALAAGVAARC